MGKAKSAEARSGPVRAYRELEGALKSDLAKGRYRVGDRLPTEA